MLWPASAPSRRQKRKNDQRGSVDRGQEGEGEGEVRGGGTRRWVVLEFGFPAAPPLSRNGDRAVPVASARKAGLADT